MASISLHKRLKPALSQSIEVDILLSLYLISATVCALRDLTIPDLIPPSFRHQHVAFHHTCPVPHPSIVICHLPQTLMPLLHKETQNITLWVMTSSPSMIHCLRFTDQSGFDSLKNDLSKLQAAMRKFGQQGKNKEAQEVGTANGI
jgi:hypothetical protein